MNFLKRPSLESLIMARGRVEAMGKKWMPGCQKEVARRYEERLNQAFRRGFPNAINVLAANGLIGREAAR